MVIYQDYFEKGAIERADCWQFITDLHGPNWVRCDKLHEEQFVYPIIDIRRYLMRNVKWDFGIAVRVTEHNRAEI